MELVLDWSKNEATGHAHAEIDGRGFDVESNGRVRELWYGREGRRLRIGAFHTEVEAKLVAQDIAESLIRQRKILEENHA